MTWDIVSIQLCQWGTRSDTTSNNRQGVSEVDKIVT